MTTTMKYKIKRKLTKKNKIKQKGGKIIASGTYGCVAKPPIKCKGETQRRKGISKLMKQKDALEELSSYNKVKTLKERDSYLLEEPHLCEVGNIE